MLNEVQKQVVDWSCDDAIRAVVLVGGMGVDVVPLLRQLQGKLLAGCQTGELSLVAIAQLCRVLDRRDLSHRHNDLRAAFSKHVADSAAASLEAPGSGRLRSRYSPDGWQPVTEEAKAAAKSA